MVRIPSQFFPTLSHVSRSYEQLTKLHPDSDDYKVYYAQSLYKAGMYPEAARASLAVDNPQYTQRMLKLQAAIRYEMDEIAASRSFVEQSLADDPEVVVSQGCLLFKVYCLFAEETL